MRGEREEREGRRGEGEREEMGGEGRVREERGEEREGRRGEGRRG